MKQLLPILVCAGLITSCTSVNEDTGKREFDEALTRAVVGSFVPFIGTTVQLASEADDNTQSAFFITESVLSNILSDQEIPINRDEIKHRLQEIEIEGLHDDVSETIVEGVSYTVLLWWDILVERVALPALHSEEDAARASVIILESLRDGIRLGLMKWAAWEETFAEANNGP